MAALLALGVLAEAEPAYGALNQTGRTLGALLVGLFLFVFWILPHIYLLVAGLYLVRRPSPNVVRTLVIINLIVGVFWNIILTVFAIINLTQLRDYEQGYTSKKK